MPLYITGAFIEQDFTYTWKGAFGPIIKKFSRAETLPVQRNGGAIYPVVNKIMPLAPTGGMDFSQHIGLMVLNTERKERGWIKALGSYRVSEDDFRGSDRLVADMGGVPYPLRVGTLVYAVPKRTGGMFFVSGAGLAVKPTARLVAWAKGLKSKQ